MPIVLDRAHLDGSVVAQHWAVFATTADAAKTRLWKKLALPSLGAPPADLSERARGERAASFRSLLVFHPVRAIVGMNWDADNSSDFICLANIHSDENQRFSTNSAFNPTANTLVADIIREYDEEWQRGQRGQGKKKGKKKGKSGFCQMFDDEAAGSGDDADHGGDGYDSANYSETEGGFVVGDHVSDSDSDSGSDSANSSSGGAIDAGEEFYYDQGPLKRRRGGRGAVGGRGRAIVVDSDSDDEEEDVEDMGTIKDVMARLVMDVITAIKPKKRVFVEESEDDELQFNCD